MFDTAKTLDILDIAMRLGLTPDPKGNAILCPFHDEKSPSFRLGWHNRFHCFGCGADGDGIDLVCRLERLEPYAALMWLKGTTTIPTRQIAPQESEPSRTIHPFTYLKAWKLCTPGEYLVHKAITSNKYGIRLITPAAEAVIPDFKVGGLMIPYYQNGYITYARWRNVDPNCDPKYKFRGAKGVPLRLYGQDSLLSLKPTPGSIYLTESETDQMTLANLGMAALAFPGAAGVTNNGLRAHFLKLVDQTYKGHVTEIVLAFDTDEAGKRASLATKEFLEQIELGMPTRHLDLGDYKDVNEAFNNGWPLV